MLPFAESFGAWFASTAIPAFIGLLVITGLARWVKARFLAAFALGIFFWFFVDTIGGSAFLYVNSGFSGGGPQLAMVLLFATGLVLFLAADKGIFSQAPSEAGALVTTCPYRFQQEGVIFKWIGETLLGVESPMIVGEVGFLEHDIGQEGNARADQTEDVGRIDSMGCIRDAIHWCALEIQTVYFSGSTMKREFKMLSTVRAGGSPFPAANRHPDYRSSGLIVGFTSSALPGTGNTFRLVSIVPFDIASNFCAVRVRHYSRAHVEDANAGLAFGAAPHGRSSR